MYYNTDNYLSNVYFKKTKKTFEKSIALAISDRKILIKLLI